MSAAMSWADAQAALTAPGAAFEMQEVEIRGVRTRVWKHAPPHLASLLEGTLAHGARDFCVYEDQRLGYRAHYRAAATIARWLTAVGVRKGDRVGLAMRNLPEWPAIFFGVTGIGAVVVPLNAWLTGPELTQALIDCGSAVLFCDAERQARLAPHLADTAVRRLVVCRPVALPPGASALEDLVGTVANYASLPAATLPPVDLAPDDAAAIFYTSGTTGRPKGALATHRNILTNILSTGYAAARNSLRRGEPIAAPSARVRLITVPLFHVTGCSSMIGSLPAGSSLVLMRRWDAQEALRLIERERVNITGGVPTVVWQLLDHPQRNRHDLSSLDTVSYGGAPASAELPQRVHRELGAMPGTGWGMTETLSIVTAVSAEDYLANPASCGPAVPVADLKIMNAEGTAALPAGQAGELWARGPMVVAGYWRRPEETAAGFRDGWVRSGDIARLDEAGFCTLLDRVKDVIIRGGENIFSGEIEQVLHTHPAVSEAALIGLPHPTLGEVPAAVVHPAPGSRVAEPELLAWLRERLAAFKVPVRIVMMEQPLPRNAGGKVQKSELRRLFELKGATS